MQPSEIVAFVYQISDVFAFLVLAAAGLAIIFGMMGIINMAHGEFIAMGGYVTTYSYHAGAPLPLAMLAGALAAGVFGMVLERLIVRRFYQRPIDSLVATWGISLIMTQGALLALGSGGADILIGPPPAALALALIKGTATAFYGQVYGVMSLLVAVCLVVRLMPEGFTGWMIRRRG